MYKHEKTNLLFQYRSWHQFVYISRKDQILITLFRRFNDPTANEQWTFIELFTYNWSVVDFAMRSARESCCTSARSGRWRISLASSATFGLWSNVSVLLEDEGPGKGNSGSTTIRQRYVSIKLKWLNESWLQNELKIERKL